MFDCWMSLDLNYARRFANAAREYGLKWLEEALPPDDYWGYAELRRSVPNGMMVTTGEHEATRWGFRMLFEMGCADLVQPDVGWCGGITELIKISALADAHNVLVVPHGSSVYSYHFVATRHNSPFAEFLMMAPKAGQVVPMFTPLLLDEPVPVNGRMKVPETPGFGVRLNPEYKLERPYTLKGHRMLLEIENKVVVVTSGSRGIGRAIALASARDGADVAINYWGDNDKSYGK